MSHCRIVGAGRVIDTCDQQREPSRLQICCIDISLFAKGDSMTVKHPLAFKILVFLEKVPRYLKEGPWSPVAYLVLTSFLGYLLINFENALVSYNQLFDVQSIHYKQNRETGNWIQYYRAFGCLYMLSITCIVLYHSGVAPLVSAIAFLLILRDEDFELHYKSKLFILLTILSSA